MDLDSAQNGGQNEAPWSEDEDMRPHTPDDTWHENSPTEVKSEARPTETKAKGFVTNFFSCRVFVIRFTKKNLSISRK